MKQRNCINHILVTHSFFIHSAHTYLSHAQSAHTHAFSQHTYTYTCTRTHLDTLQLSTGYFRTQCCWVACYTICISWTVSLKMTCFLSQWEDTSFTNRHCSLFYVLVAGSVTHLCESSLSKLSAPPAFIERPERVKVNAKARWQNTSSISQTCKRINMNKVHWITAAFYLQLKATFSLPNTDQTFCVLF